MHRKVSSLLNLFVAISMVLTLFAVGPASGAAAQAAPAAGGPGEVAFLTGPNQGQPVDIALAYIQKNAGSLGLTAADLSDYVVTDQYRSAHNGVTHIYLRQRYHGIEIAGANISINIARNGSVINLGNDFVANLASKVNRETPLRTASQAISAAAGALELDMSKSPVQTGSKSTAAMEATFSGGSLSMSPIPAKLVYHIVSSGELRLAWNLEIEEFSGQHYWSVNVDAEDGQMLGQIDYVAHDTWGAPYETDDELGAGVVASGLPASRVNAQPLVASAATLTGHGGYRVYDLPTESPNFGPRGFLMSPGDPLASPYGWHDVNGIAGAEYTVTRGNNVYAYTDTDADNVADAGSAPDGGFGLNFDFPLDLTQPPSTFVPASVTNLFYVNNAFHDILYLYGFTEAAGNFQENNYGRGGLGGDYVRAEGQDGAGVNNANFGTPPDGQLPRMQMFVWKDPAMTLTVTAPPAIAGEYEAAAAAFGPDTYDITADTAVADPILGCGPLNNAAAVAGKIAIIDRGTCNFLTKVLNAQAAGAVGVIVKTYVGQAPAGMGCTAGCDAAVIPSVQVSYNDGELFKASVPLPTVHLQKGGLPDRDGDFDNGVIIHEFTHGLSNRLVGGPANVGCLQNAEQMGEGWSDFVGLVLTDKGDRTTRALATYDMYQPADGAGIRPTPYSLDMGINPTTYGDIPGLAVPHGVGYAFNSMLWEVYWNLIDKYGFNPNIYDEWYTGGNNLTLQLVMDGMKMTRCSPGFVDARNSILAADIALTGGQNYCEIWAGFAKRGLGYSADQGDPLDNTDGTEAFDMPSACATPVAEVNPATLSSTQVVDKQEALPLGIKNANAPTGANSVTTTTETVHQDEYDVSPDSGTYTVYQDDPNDPFSASVWLPIWVEDTMLLEITTCCTSDPNADIDLYVFQDSTGAQVGVSGSGGSDEYVLLTMPQDDWYWILLHGWAVPTGETTVELSIRSMYTPAAGGTPSYFSTIVNAADLSLLQFNTANSGLGSDVDLFVFGPDGSLVNYSATPGTDTEQVLVGAPANGDYTVVVTGPYVPTGTDTFDLTITKVSGVGFGLTWDVFEAPTDCANLADIPWVSVSPDWGVAGAGLTSFPQVTFDSTGLAPGNYTGKLCVFSNDPVSSPIEVPLSLTVLYGMYVPVVFGPAAP